jgi:type VI secretion system secreted protein VgrG
MINDRLHVTVASGDRLDVRHFRVDEAMSSPFEISLVCVSDNADIDFEAVAGQPMTFGLRLGILPREERTWTGVCSRIQLVATEEEGLSTYELTLVPTLWFLTQRRNHRMFQLASELDIVKKLLEDWGIEPVLHISGEYKKRRYRVQYGESDFTFMSRMLEDAGISFYFETQEGETKLVLHDAPQSNAARSPKIAYRDNPTKDLEHVTHVRVERRVRPGKYTLRDHDYRRPPSYQLMASSQGGGDVESKLERFHYTPGAFLFESEKGDATPNADDKGKYRTDEGEGGTLAQKRLDAKRAIAKTVLFDATAVDLAPGTVVAFLDHPRSDLAPGKEHLVLRSALVGRHDGEWVNACEAVSAKAAYRPPMSTPKPKVMGVESGTVVGPAGDEIHTDEFGRVRVHFHWDRESEMNESSSCWIHASQPWGGSGFGGSNLPRVGQEVIIDFLGGDPDRPVVVGRLYTNLQKTPYKLPDNKTQSGWQSRSSPGGTADNYNELMFEDKIGQELLRMQAEKDLKKLVKNDEEVTIGRDRAKKVGRDDQQHVGHDRSRTVGHDESVAVAHNQDISIGQNLAKQVAGFERELTGLSRTIIVGLSRSTAVGIADTTTVGELHSISIVPPVAAPAAAPAAPAAGAGGPAGAPAPPPAPATPPPPTAWTMRNNKIELSTPAGASITLDGDKIILKAKGGILIEATSGDVVVKGLPKIKLNP